VPGLVKITVKLRLLVSITYFCFSVFCTEAFYVETIRFMELSYPRIFVPWNLRSQELSFPDTDNYWTP